MEQGDHGGIDLGLRIENVDQSNIPFAHRGSGASQSRGFEYKIGCDVRSPFLLRNSRATTPGHFARVYDANVR